jgi:hypothetical protein
MYIFHFKFGCLAAADLGLVNSSLSSQLLFAFLSEREKGDPK